MRLAAAHRKLIHLLILPLTVASLALGASFALFEGVGALNSLAVEDNQRAAGMRSFPLPNKDIVVVTFDESTGQKLGLGPDVKFPPHSSYAQFLSLLDEAGAKVALFDVMFNNISSEDRELHTTLASLKSLRVTLATSHDDQSSVDMDTSGPIVKGPMLRIPVWDDTQSDRVRLGSIFNEATQNSFIGANPIQEDSTTGKRILYAPISAALQSQGIGISNLSLDETHRRLSAGSLEWNLDANYAIEARWTRTPAPFKHIDYVAALNQLRDPAKQSLFRDKLVIIGYSGNADNVDTALGRMHGLDYIAQMTNTALLAHHDQFQDVPNEVFYPYCLALGFGAFLALRTKRALVAVSGLVALAIVCAETQRWFALNQDMILSTTIPGSVIVLSSLAGIVLGRYWTDEVELSPPSPAEEATVLFLDIKGSTKLLNSIGRGRYQPLLDSLFRRYTPIVERCGGQIERTLGDGFIAVFRNKHTRHHALRCSDCCKELVKATEEIAAKQGINVQVALGFESGIVGGDYVYEAGKKVWSSSGSTVHLAQRIQSLCGPLNVTVAVGPVARRLIADEENCEVITHAVVKGFEEAVEVSRLS